MDKEFLKQLSVPELVGLQHDLRRFPEDKEHLADVMEEIKQRGKERDNEK